MPGCRQRQRRQRATDAAADNCDFARLSFLRCAGANIASNGIVPKRSTFVEVLAGSNAAGRFSGQRNSPQASAGASIHRTAMATPSPRQSGGRTCASRVQRRCAARSTSGATTSSRSMTKSSAPSPALSASGRAAALRPIAFRCPNAC
jgi:hypothetical protein